MCCRTNRRRMRALRPSRLDEFVGQEQVKSSLQIAIDAAKQRGDTLDHTLFFGPPGLGKTTLAMLMAREMGVQLRVSSGPVLEKPGDLVGLLTGLAPGDMLFIDEIHRLQAGAGGIPLPGDGRLPGGRADQRRPQRADDPDDARALHADRRDDALRPADAADAGALRDRGAARLLLAGGAAADHHAVGEHPQRAGGCRGRDRDRAAEPGHAADREPAAAAGAGLRAGEGGGAGSPDRSPTRR